MSNTLKLNFKPSLVIGWDKAGKAHAVLLGDAEETLARFKEERDKKNYVRVAWFRKMRQDKQKWTDRPQNEVTSIDNSKYDGDAGAALLKKETAEAENKSTAPKKGGKSQ
jgi:hypothetical protein